EPFQRFHALLLALTGRLGVVERGRDAFDRRGPRRPAVAGGRRPAAAGDEPSHADPTGDAQGQPGMSSAHSIQPATTTPVRTSHPRGSNPELDGGAGGGVATGGGARRVDELGRGVAGRSIRASWRRSVPGRGGSAGGVRGPEGGPEGGSPFAAGVPAVRRRPGGGGAASVDGGASAVSSAGDASSSDVTFGCSSVPSTNWVNCAASSSATAAIFAVMWPIC